MKNQTTENQNNKLKKMDEELRELWETLTPSEKNRRSIFNKFLELQKQLQAIQQRNQNLEKGN